MEIFLGIAASVFGVLLGVIGYLYVRKDDSVERRIKALEESDVAQADVMSKRVEESLKTSSKLVADMHDQALRTLSAVSGESKDMIGRLAVAEHKIASLEALVPIEEKRMAKALGISSEGWRLLVDKINKLDKK